MPAAVMCAELVAPVANMLAAAVAHGGLARPGARVPAPAQAQERAPAQPAPGTHGRLEQPREAHGERAHEAAGNTSAAGRGGLRAPVHAGPGPRAHRVHDAPVRAGRGGDPAGLAGRRGRGDRRGLGSLDRGPRRVQGPGGPDLPGGSGRGVRVGDLPAGPVLRGPVPAAGAGPVDRHPGHRRRRRLRPRRLQRPPPAGPEGHHVRSIMPTSA